MVMKSTDWTYSTDALDYIAIEKEISVPLIKLSNKLKRSPICSYTTLVLDNWHRRDLGG